MMAAITRGGDVDVLVQRVGRLQGAPGAARGVDEHELDSAGGSSLHRRRRRGWSDASARSSPTGADS